VRHPTDNRVHFSELKQLARSPAHYAYACQHARDPSRAMTVGSVGDAIVFGTTDRIAVYPGATRRGKEWDAFKAAHPDKTIAIQSEVDDATGAAEAILRDPIAAPILAECETQIVIQWEQMGLPCASGIIGERGGIDALARRTRTIWDVKMVGVDCDPEGLAKHAWRQFWHAQLAWLVDGWNAGIDDVAERAGSLKIEHAGLICVEANPPHCVTVMQCTPEALDHGRRSIRLWLERLAACEGDAERAAANGSRYVWPGYVQTIAEMGVPAWLTDEE
jgi:hypothetical protein